MSSSSVPFFAFSKNSLELFSLDTGSVTTTNERVTTQFSIEEGVALTRPAKFVKKNTLMVTCCADSVTVWNVNQKSIDKVVEVEVVGCLDYAISPEGNYLATLQKFIPPTDGSNPLSNVWIWKLTGRKVEKKIGFAHKNLPTWMPQWSSDDRFMGRMVNGEVQIFTEKDVDLGESRPAFRVNSENLTDFLICPGKTTTTIDECWLAVFVKEVRGLPGSVRIYRIGEEKAAVQRVFFKADRIRMLWSPDGKYLLAMTNTDVDKTGQSYYGESNLYFLSRDGSFDCRVSLDKEGPIQDFAWSPTGNEFIAIYGFMPAKTTLFNLKCQPIYTFACGAKNLIRYSPHGNLICFGGFGNLPGTVEIWRRTGTVSRVGAFQAAGTSVCEWSADGRVLLTGTVSPRLRVDNAWKIWSIAGELLAQRPYNELFQVCRLGESFEYPISKIEDLLLLKGSQGIISGSANNNSSTLIVSNSTGELKKEAYRPPRLRNRDPDSSTVKKESTPIQSQPPPPVNLPSTLTKEAKAVKKAQDKLDAIAALKDRKAAGEQLELNQVVKLEKEAEARRELEAALKALKLSQS